MCIILNCSFQNRDPKGKEVIHVGGRITSLTFLFPCDMAATDNPDGVKLFGTGGKESSMCLRKS